ncbi:MAG: GDYXXLXY domain-containing protein [Bacteroidia bacterium]|nr:GDYXXLXY domain-containing protein [Bacteroidia bacterium]
MKHLFYILNLVLFFVIFNFMIWKKEQVLKTGKIVYLELSPVDPRSLMQGDFMRLEYRLLDSLTWKDSLNPANGFCILDLDSLNIAQQIAYGKDLSSLKPNQAGVRFHYNGSMIRIGAEAYFFEEGKAYTLDSAKYGGLRVSETGETVLTGLYDRNLRFLDTQKDSLSMKSQEQ